MSVAGFDSTGDGVEITSTPFFPQERYQCGPAALTTVLTHSGVQAPLDTITQMTYIPGRQGSLRPELLATARRYERLPYVIDPSMSALVDELYAGRPVLVLQNLGPGWAPRWHYAVVIGIDIESNHVILRSGTQQRRETKLRTFLHTWRRSDYWAAVMLMPGELPENADRSRYLAAVADLDAVGNYDAAGVSWTAALEAWPGDPLAMFGQANTTFLLGDFAASERLYRALLNKQPDMHMARNNLAYALAGQGKLSEAVDELERLITDVAVDDPMYEEFVSSLRELQSRRGKGGT